MPRTATERLPEIKAMDAIATALDGLEDAERNRVLAWVYDRYQPGVHLDISNLEHLPETLRAS